MKLLFENWRKHLNEEKIEIEAEDKLLFYEWLVNDLKDETFIKWIEIHQERAKWVAPREGYLNPAEREYIWHPWELKKPSDACTLRHLFDMPPGLTKAARAASEKAGVRWSREVEEEVWAAGEARLEQFNAAHKEILEHLEQIKVKFPYDLFAEFDCKQKMEHLDELVKSVVRCPYQTYSGPVSEVLSTKSLQNEPTPYEKCIKEFQDQSSAESEIEELDPYRWRSDPANPQLKWRPSEAWHESITGRDMKLIFENWRKHLNEEQEVDEGIGKALGTAPLGLALAGPGEAGATSGKAAAPTTHVAERTPEIDNYNALIGLADLAIAHGRSEAERSQEETKYKNVLDALDLARKGNTEKLDNLSGYDAELLDILNQHLQETPGAIEKNRKRGVSRVFSSIGS